MQADPGGEEILREVEAERAADVTAVMERVHRPMKKWFRTKPELKESYGRFPLFWQDLRLWDDWNSVYKLYMADIEAKEGGHVENVSVVGVEDGEQAVPEAETGTSAATDSEVSDNNAVKKRRRTRWGTHSSKEADAKKRRSRWASKGSNALTGDQLQMIQLRCQLNEVNNRLATVVVDAKRKELDSDRSPSPPPQYDSNGKRTNTMELRMRVQLTEERQKIMEEMFKLNPMLAGGRPAQKFVKKLFVPQKENPGYNFIGLIIGPRGNTHRRMEAETHCRISIRGKGSVKEGRSKHPDDDMEELHVLITGNNQEDLDKAVKEVSELLVPVDDEFNDRKREQLRELALINGTMSDDDFCHVCGEKGHRQFECPNRQRNYKMADVVCKICGDSSHVTADCKQGKDGEPVDEAKMDEEYLNFMAELGGPGAGGQSQKKPVQQPPVSAALVQPPANIPQPPIVTVPSGMPVGIPAGMIPGMPVGIPAGMIPGMHAPIPMRPPMQAWPTYPHVQPAAPYGYGYGYARAPTG